ncbi:MAG: tryptophan 2,3-dioxygenase [Proteobacteria bacterium]|nr:tryptophan 2,3-dioxygenase [Pseudomonadota bacterium]MBI3498354.1 tryptophan 2,3-dioxygenase [Pseudomonadota bacterium]
MQMSGSSASGSPAESGAHTDFAKEMSYGDYLQLDQLLSAQRLVSGSHDELLFITIHQATELWLKLALHELKAAIDRIRADDLSPSFKMLARVGRILSQLIQSWDVLSTMTPADYLSFRDQLGHSSGFQSYQYRLVEFVLGNKNRAMLAPHIHRPDIHGQLQSALESPSLYDEAIRLLGRRGLGIAKECLERDWSLPREPHASVSDAWLKVYRDTTRYWDLYELAEELVDLEDSVQQWRFRHATTVKRVIGFKRGTGGTAGVPYLYSRLEHVFFPELWQVRTEL